MAEMPPVEPTGEDLQNPPGTDNGSDVPAAVDTPLAAPDSSAAAPDSVPTAPAATSEVQPVVASAPVAPVAPAQQVVYVEAPKPFVAKGNRGFGILIAILSAVIFTALNAVAEIVFELVNGQPIDVSFLTTTGFYAPTVMFAVGFILLVLIVNRAGWAAHVLGSIFVGLVVFFGGTGLLLLLNISSIPSNEVSEAFTRTLFSPELIIAGLLAREVCALDGRRNRFSRSQGQSAQRGCEGAVRPGNRGQTRRVRTGQRRCNGGSGSGGCRAGRGGCPGRGTDCRRDTSALSEHGPKTASFI